MDNLEALIQKYPRLFEGREFYIPGYVQAGWHPIVDRLCAQLDAAMTDEEAAQFAVLQIKQKFGGLRFYFRIGGEETVSVDMVIPGIRQRMKVIASADKPRDLHKRLNDLVDAAEIESLVTCEACGRPGKLHGGGWLRTLCAEHAAERDAGSAGEW